jgi:very-short-patch-repair endonuclease
VSIPRSPAVRRPTRKPEREASPAEIWAREEAAARRRGLEDRLAQHIKAWGLPTPEREYRFDPVRLWRFDFSWPSFMVAAEVEGLTPQGGRHQRLSGFQRDAEKYTAAALAGWTVLRFTAGMVRSAYAVRAIQTALERASAARPPG